MLQETEGFSTYRPGLNPRWEAQVHAKRRAERQEAARREAEDRAAAEKLKSQYRQIVVKAVKRPVARIIEEVAAEHGITVEDIVGPSHKRQHLIPRQIAMFRAKRELPEISYGQLGRIFRRDPTTVCHAVEKMRRQGSESNGK